MKPSWGELLPPFPKVLVGDSVTDFALSAMFLRKFMFLALEGCHGDWLDPHPPPCLLSTFTTVPDHPPTALNCPAR